MFENPMRVSGLVSGMDIDSMVDKLMKAERMPLDQMKQDQKTLEWKRDGYREMNKLLDGLDRSIFDGISRNSTFSSKSVTSTDEQAVTAVASGLKNNTTSRISVSQLAQAASGVSGTIGSDDDFDGHATLSSQAGKLNSGEFGSHFQLNVFQPDGTMASKDIEIDPSEDSLNDILERVNASGLGVTAFYDEGANRISIASNHTGENKDGAEISVDEKDGTLFSEVFQWGSADAEGTVTVADNGQNAAFTLNGLETERTSNTFTINHLTYTLKETTSTPVSLATSTDTDDIYEAVEGFVDQYNDTIAAINDKLGEERDREYPPLTDAQREDLSDHEIELWEEKAQSGMLRGDPILSGALTQMRTDLYGRLEGEDVDEGSNQLSKLGIVTSSDYREKGKLIIQDPEKLRGMITDDPQAVSRLFNHSGETSQTRGLAGRLRDTIANTVEHIENKAGNSYMTAENYTLGKQMKRNDQQMDDLNDRLDDIEDRYYRQFSRMEQAIQKANQQSAYISNAFSQNPQ